MAIVDEFVAILGYDLEGEGKLRSFNRSLDNLAEKGRAAALTMTKWAAVASGAAAAAAGVLGRSVLNTGAQFEGFETALTTITGSAEEAKRSMDWISDFAVRTPYEVAGLTDAFIRLKAYGIDPIAGDALQSLGNMSSAMNKPLMDSVEMLSDAMTFQFERLRSFGITASQAGDEVTFSYRKNGEELTRTLKKNGEEIRKFLLEDFGEQFAGAMDDQSNTFAGILSNVMEKWTIFQRMIADAGFFDEAKKRLQGLLDTLDRLQSDGTLERWAETFSNFYVGVMDFGQNVVQRVMGHLQTLRDMFSQPDWQALINPLIGAFAALAFWAAPVMSVFAALILLVDDFLTWKAGGDSVIGQLVEWFEKWADVDLSNINAETEGLGAALNTVAEAAQNVLSALKEMRDFFNADLGWMERLDKLGSGISNVARSLVPGFLGDQADRAQGVGTRFRESVLGTGSRTSDTQVADKIANAVDQLTAQLGGSAEAREFAEGLDVSQLIEQLKIAAGVADPNELSMQITGALNNFAANSANIDAAPKAVTNDNSQDNRDQSTHVANTANVTQNITMQQAPAAAARAVGNATANSANQAARINSGSGAAP